MHFLLQKFPENRVVGQCPVFKAAEFFSPRSCLLRGQS